MATKTITITEITVRSNVFDAQQSRRGSPDPYVVFSSQRAQIGDRSQYQMNNRSPTFAGPYVLSFGGPRDSEQLRVDLWDRDRGAPSNDDLMESANLSFQGEGVKGTKTWALSRGGEVRLSWEIRGREAAPPPASSESSGQGLVKISRLALSDLLRRDGRRGTVDPYVLLTGLSVEVQERWNTKRDDAQPVWQEDHEITWDSVGYSVEVWDDDFGSGDDLCGSVDIRFDRTRTEMRAEMELMHRGRRYNAGEISFTYVVESSTEATGPIEKSTTPREEAPEPEPVPSVGPTVVTRREIRKMPKGDQARFVAALKKTMENTSGPQTSEYFRIAGYHGWPTDYCQHGQETFPGWHRGYLLELELALQRADREMGRDGNIAMPYWDWSDLTLDEVMPKIIRDEFSKLPAGLLDPSDEGGAALLRRGYDGIRDEETLKRNLENARVAFQAEQCLSVAEHWMHASTRFNRQGYPVESPHNSVHVACGFPMTSVRYAAFHPIFFLHHCNVDRIYERHVQMETATECAQEFSNRQRQLSRSRGEVNRYARPLEPFRHPTLARSLMPADTFDTRSLGYQYDELPPRPAMSLREAPVFAAFLRCKPMELANQSYMLHVFVLPKDKASTWKPPSDQSMWMTQESYAGCGAIFGPKGADCKNCQEREPFNVLVEVQDALKRQNLSLHDATTRVLCVGDNAVVPLEDTKLDPPVLIGPLFADTESSLSSHSKQAGDVHQLQKQLSLLGFYRSSLDGEFGTKTEEAVKSFQKFTGIRVDGIAGKITKSSMLQKRFDMHPDAVRESKEVSLYTEGSTACYTVGILPGYLNSVKAQAEIHDAFEQWGDAMGICFKHVASGVKATVRVDFEDLAAIGESISGGLASIGGQLAEATRQGVRLDVGERWLLRDQQIPEAYPQAIHLFPVILHEIGHVIGLAHSSDPQDVMWPYVKAEAIVKLSANDVARARARVTRVASTEETQGDGKDSHAMRRELQQLRSEVAAMRGEMREMSRLFAASFDGKHAVGSAVNAARCCSDS